MAISIARFNRTRLLEFSVNSFQLYKAEVWAATLNNSCYRNPTNQRFILLRVGALLAASEPAFLVIHRVIPVHLLVREWKALWFGRLEADILVISTKQTNLS